MKGRKGSGDIENSGTYPGREGRTILSSFRKRMGLLRGKGCMVWDKDHLSGN